MNVLYFNQPHVLASFALSNTTIQNPKALLFEKLTAKEEEKNAADTQSTEGYIPISHNNRAIIQGLPQGIISPMLPHAIRPAGTEHSEPLVEIAFDER